MFSYISIYLYRVLVLGRQLSSDQNKILKWAANFKRRSLLTIYNVKYNDIILYYLFSNEKIKSQVVGGTGGARL